MAYFVYFIEKFNTEHDFKLNPIAIVIRVWELL